MPKHRLYNSMNTVSDTVLPEPVSPRQTVPPRDAVGTRPKPWRTMMPKANRTTHERDVMGPTTTVAAAPNQPTSKGRAGISREILELERALNPFRDCPRAARPISDIPDWILNGG